MANIVRASVYKKSSEQLLEMLETVDDSTELYDEICEELDRRDNYHEQYPQDW